MIDKLPMTAEGASRELIAKIADLVPDALVEARDGKGQIQASIDLQVLALALGTGAVENGSERYRIDWPGKRSALLEANAPLAKTLRPASAESVAFASTKNVFIEGDNLDAIKLMREGMLGRIDMIYIDPPYNTGSDLIYRDTFVDTLEDHLVASGQSDDVGARLTSNVETNGRFHSDWLSMMYSRLRVARQLLAESGLIFISIDDNERANLEKLCDEVFGASRFLGCFVWKRRSGAMDAVTNLSEDHEYVLVYSKGQATLRGVERTFEKYTNPDDDPRGPWIADNLTAGKPGGDTYYSIRDPETGNEFLPPKGRYWPYSRQTMAQKIAEGRVIFPKVATGTPMLKRFANEAIKPTIPVSSWIERPGSSSGQSTLVSPMNSSATKELKELFDGKLFSFPKPVELLQALIEQGMPKDGIVLDFFAGSATTAQAAFACNAKDGGRRQFILVQVPETISAGAEAFEQGYSSIADLAKERIRRAGKKVLEGNCHPDWDRDVGFRVLKIDSSNMKDVYYRPDEVDQANLLDMVDNVKEGRTAEDLLFQVLVDWGVHLSLPIRQETIEGKNVFFVDDNALVACFETGISEELVKALAKREPLRVVFRDNGFASDAVKINVEQIFRQLSPATEVRSI